MICSFFFFLYWLPPAFIYVFVAAVETAIQEVSQAAVDETDSIFVGCFRDHWWWVPRSDSPHELFLKKKKEEFLFVTSVSTFSPYPYLMQQRRLSSIGAKSRWDVLLLFFFFLLYTPLCNEFLPPCVVELLLLLLELCFFFFWGGITFVIFIR